MIRTAAAALAVLAFTAPMTAHANGKKPSPSQAAYNKAIANAKASAAAKAQAGAVAGGGSASGGTASNEGDHVDGSWGFSYARNPVAVPQAVVGPDVMVLSRGVEIGPIGSYSDQRGELTPDGLVKLGAVLDLASTTDGTPAGRERALNMAAVICAKDPELARIRFGDKCDDLGSLFPPAGVGE